LSTVLSVNINKIATIRNARGGNIPDVLQVALDCEKFGADGITVHPRPDERHIRYDDVRNLRGKLTTEFNIEGNPTSSFIQLVLEVRPHQATLVPDAADALTSDAGWNTITHQDYLKDIIKELKQSGIRTSLFINADPKMIEAAAQTGTDRIELYTGPYAHQYEKNKKAAITPFHEAALVARSLGLDINAGHDLSLDNLCYFISHIPFTKEVSIGHALISDALYFGLEKTIKLYKEQISIALDYDNMHSITETTQ
jgi:pyridoxine 5-phosphate synthase